MNETLITDLVAQQALDQLDDLDRKMEGTLQQFKDCALELAKGIKIPIEVNGDLERLRELANGTMHRATEAAQQYTQTLQQQQQVVANTTNTISRQLMEQERLNKAQREAFTQQQQALDIADRILGSHEQNVRALARYTKQLEQLKAERKAGTVTSEEYIRRELELKTAKQELQRILTNEQKMNQAAAGSYQQLSLQLERLKQAQKQLNEEEKRGADGQALEKEIQQLDAHLKDLAADMGEFQRNVGNYAIAAQNMKGTLRQLTEEIAQLTLQYEELSDEEKRSDVGMQMRDKITQLTEEAGKYRDIVSDVKQSISASASDTRLFDSLIEAGQVFAATMGVATTACRALGMSEDSLQQSMLKVQQAMQAVQALQVIQNTLQKQSNLMKGIAILQSKAAAAAARMEAAATASATGATKAQTAAQIVFNAVAKANPYVLLATAILAVIGLIIGYTAATKDASEADKDAKEAADARRESIDSMAQSFGNTAGELIAKYKLMREQWNALGDDIKAKEQYIKDQKTDFDKLSEAVNGAGTKVNNVKDAENLFSQNTSKVQEAIKRRAMAMAAYAEYIRLTQLELQELEQISANSKYRSFKSGDEITISNAEELFKHGLGQSALKANTRQQYNHMTGESVDVTTGYTVVDAGAATEADRRRAVDARIKAEEKVQQKYDALRLTAWKKAEQNGAFDPANFRGGGGGGGGNKTTTTKGGGGGNKNAPQVKEADDIMKEVDAIILQAVKGQVAVAEEGTEEWSRLTKEALNEQAEADKKAAEEKRVKTLEELNKTHAAGKMSDEDYNQQVNYLNEATAQVKRNIENKLAEDLKKVDEDVLKHKEELADEEVEKIANAAAAAQVLRDQQYQQDVKALYDEYTEALKVAVQKGEDTTKITELYNKKKEAIDNQYANDTVQAQIDAITKELAVENLSEEEREQLQRELTQLTTDLAQQRAEQEKKSIEDTVKAEEDARKRRQESLQNWVQKAGEAIDKISGFVSALYDNQIAKIEELLEAEQEQYEKEVEHIEYLAERGAITSEEAEIRKRDAAAATAKKQEELEKRKAALEYKKAVTEKVNSVSQAAISTALGIMSALAQFPGPVGWALAAAVGAMGAIQIATILAQPIKAYKEGTKGKPHPGGLALVGEGGNQELVMYNGKAWVTPDKPTLLDLPRGAEVFPDATPKDLLSLGASLPMAVPRDRKTGQPVIINDYSALESRVATNTKAVTKTLNQFSDRMAREMKRQKFNAYIASRI